MLIKLFIILSYSLVNLLYESLTWLKITLEKYKKSIDDKKKSQKMKLNLIGKEVGGGGELKGIFYPTIETITTKN